MYNIKVFSDITAEINIPPDKSISHRAVILAAMSVGRTIVCPFLRSDDTSRTIECLKKMGVTIKWMNGNTLIVHGAGKFFKRKKTVTLNAGESGTTMRILSGIVCAQKFKARMDCLPALKKRPMARVVTPLVSMGAKIEGRKRNNNLYAPLDFMPTSFLIGGKFKNAIASAQIKSALMLAALYARGVTVISEPYKSRDHTERMFGLFNIPLKVKNRTIEVRAIDRIKSPGKVFVPGDFSAAAFFLVLGVLTPDSCFTLKGVNINRTRAGLLTVLKRMGARVRIINRKKLYEDTADIIVQTSKLSGVTIDAKDIPAMIDEIPILAVACSFAVGRTVINGVKELKVKETDRLEAIKRNLKAAGARVSIERYIDTDNSENYRLVIAGASKLKRAQFKSFGDHRIAMSAIVLGIASGMGGEIDDTKCVNKSFPDFIDIIENLK